GGACASRAGRWSASRWTPPPGPVHAAAAAGGWCSARTIARTRSDTAWRCTRGRRRRSSTTTGPPACSGRSTGPGVARTFPGASRRRSGERERSMILLKSKEQIEQMRAANGIVAEILAEVRSRVRPGVSTAELDTLAEELTVKRGARPAFKGYAVAGRVFPASICISINDEVVHGIPSERRVLRDGDIVGLDFGVCYNGYYGDAAMTVPVGRVTSEATRLMDVTRAA